MSQGRRCSPGSIRKRAPRGMDTMLSPVAQCVLGALFVAAIAVLSLPQARAVSASLGWVPFWLLALPASAWLALQAQRYAMRLAATPVPLVQRRRGPAPATRRRAVAGARDTRRASAA